MEQRGDRERDKKTIFIDFVHGTVDYLGYRIDQNGLQPLPNCNTRGSCTS